MILTDPLKFTIHLDPKTKKNSMQPRLAKGGRFLGMMQSSAYQRYEKDCLHTIPGAVRVGVDAPVNVQAIYYMRTRRKVDKTNLESALLDILVKAGVLTDDNSHIVFSTDGSRVRYSKEDPRTEVMITPAKDADCQMGMEIEAEQEELW